MKKAPRRYAIGGSIDDDPKKKKKFTSTTPTAMQQMVDKGYANQSTADAMATENYALKIQDDNYKRANLGLQGAGTGISSGRTFVGSDANGNTTYRDTKTGETYTLDKTGKRYAKGGEVGSKFEGSSKSASSGLGSKEKFNPNNAEQIKRAFGVDIDKKAKGGTIKKMTKAPCRMKKGGTC